HSELLLEGENQIQVMNGVPGFNILRGRLWRDLVRADLQNIGSDAANSFEERRAHPLSPFTICSRTHSGQATLLCSKLSPHNVPWPFCSSTWKPWLE